MLEWRELEPGVWGATTPEGLDFLIEKITDPTTREPLYEASQLRRTCCSTFQHRLKKFKSCPEARQFLETLPANTAEGEDT